MKVLRLIVPSNVTYALNHLSEAAGIKFDDRQVVDVPLNSNEQLSAARTLERMFVEDNLSAIFRNGAKAVSVYSAEVVDI